MPDPAPKLSGPDILGGPPFDLADHKGSYVFVAFMGLPWCDPCKLELPHLLAVAEEYAVNSSSPAVRFVIVNYRLGYQLSTVVTLAAAEGIALPIVDDEGGGFVQAFSGQQLWPQSYVVRPSGVLSQHHHTGAAGADQLQALLLQSGAPAPGGIGTPYTDLSDQPPPVAMLDPDVNDPLPKVFPVPVRTPPPWPKPLSLLSRQIMRALALHDAAAALADRDDRRQVRGAALRAATATLRRLESIAAVEAKHGPTPQPAVGPPRDPT